jgi:Na+/serine symporter
LSINLTGANEYGQSPVTLATAAFPTQTQAAAGTQQGCFTLQTAVTGTSGKFWVSAPTGNFINFANAAVGTQVLAPEATTANGSTINLTKQIYLAVNLQAANANNITGPIVNSVTIDQEQ